MLWGAALMLAASLVACGPAEKLQFKGTDITGAEYGRSLALTDQDGKSRSLADFKGKVVVVFFGYTQCPDVCPTTMAELAQVKKSLGKDGERLQGIFVTVDPERDTPAVMKDYLQSFDPHLKGLSGSPEAVAKMIKEYRVYAKKIPLKDGDYTMDHTAAVYLLDREGQFAVPFNLKQTPQQAAADLKRYF